MKTIFKICFWAFVTSLLTIFIGVQAFAGDISKQEESKIGLLNTKEHIKYLETEKGFFRPYDAITRSEAAHMFYTLLNEKINPPEFFTDLGNSSVYKEANALAYLGIMLGNDGKFEPEKPLTRAEFSVILNRFFPNEEINNDKNIFTDVNDNHWAKDSILFVNSKGWIVGTTGSTFAPNEIVTRTSAAIIMNKVLNRSCDQEAVKNEENAPQFLDIMPTDWFYYSICEATVPHEYIKSDTGIEEWTDWKQENTGISEGLFSYRNSIYHINAQGKVTRSATVGAYTFDEYGRYTTGNAELDSIITNIVKSTTTDSMTIQEKRRALYLHMRDSYKYVKRPFVTKGDKGWENDYALKFFRDKSGNCFSYAAAYGLLLRSVGLDVDIINGGIKAENAVHSWVEVIIDGKAYIDDPELEMANIGGKNKIKFYNLAYDEVPFAYRK